MVIEGLFDVEAAAKLVGKLRSSQSCILVLPHAERSDAVAQRAPLTTGSPELHCDMSGRCKGHLAFFDFSEGNVTWNKN
jgi:hypothetical protein